MTNVPFGKRVFRVACTAAIALAVVSCGGGESPSSAAEPTPVTPAGPAAEPAAVTSVPPPFYPGDLRRAPLFKRLNEIRSRAGVGLLTQRPELDGVAQDHTYYQLVNNEDGPTETPGKRGYAGPTSDSRINDQSDYLGLLESAEVTAALPFVNEAPSLFVGVDLLNLLMGSPYHRDVMLRAEYADVGLGVYDWSSATRLTIDFARTRANTQGAPDTPLIIWPPDKSNGIPTSMFSGSLRPIPENNGAPAGYAASVQVSRNFWMLDVTRFEIRESATGVLVDTKLLSFATDSQLNTTFNDHAFAAAFPKAPLAKNTAYTVTFEGTRTPLHGGVASPVSKTWSFTTGANDFF